MLSSNAVLTILQAFCNSQVHVRHTSCSCVDAGTMNALSLLQPLLYILHNTIHRLQVCSCNLNILPVLPGLRSFTSSTVYAAVENDFIHAVLVLGSVVLL